MIFDLSFKVKWKDVLDNRKRHILENNECKNYLRIDYTYQIGDQVLVN